MSETMGNAETTESATSGTEQAQGNSEPSPEVVDVEPVVSNEADGAAEAEITEENGNPAEEEVVADSGGRNEIDDVEEPPLQQVDSLPVVIVPSNDQVNENEAPVGQDEETNEVPELEDAPNSPTDSVAVVIVPSLQGTGMVGEPTMPAMEEQVAQNTATEGGEDDDDLAALEQLQTDITASITRIPNNNEETNEIQVPQQSNDSQINEETPLSAEERELNVSSVDADEAEEREADLPRNSDEQNTSTLPPESGKISPAEETASFKQVQEEAAAQEVLPKEEVPPPMKNITPVENEKDVQDEVQAEMNDLLQTSNAADNEEHEEEEGPVEVRFKVKTPGGKIFNMKQPITATVLEIKETLAKMSDVLLEVEEIKLIHRGLPLRKNNDTVQSLNIKDGDDLFMIKKLLGAKKDEKAGPKIEKTNPRDRGFITITIPQGARPGNRLLIHPPGRSRMAVYIPRGHGPGDTLRVQLPPETNANANNATNSQRQNNSSQQTNVQQRPHVPPQDVNVQPVPPHAVLKVICPQDSQAGSEVLVTVPGHGLLKVTVPPTARPGWPFYFRVAPGL